MSPPNGQKTEQLTPSADEPVPLKLVVVAGPAFGRELVLATGSYRIGKDPANDLVIEDSAISRVHLEVSVLPHGLRVVDNQSTNGSFFEGVRFSQIDAPVGTVLRIGRSALKVMPVQSARSAVPPSEGIRFGELIGASLKMRELFGQLERVAKTDTDVLVRGETGTGKELCARALHAHGSRAAAPFVVCDLAALVPTLIESELFGHRRGAFSGASQDRAGAFERAHGGTLFLDEVGELPLELQPRLLRALEQRQVKRVGADEYRTVDVRVIAATNRDLAQEVALKRFRDDLFFRLDVVTLVVPPLRERPEDIPLLARAFLRQLGLSPELLSPETLALLRTYRWPGNVRELLNTVERVVNLGVEGIPDELRKGLAPFKQAKEELVTTFERDYLIQLMAQCEENLSRASREAGIDRVYLRRLLRKHGLRAE